MDRNCKQVPLCWKCHDKHDTVECQFIKQTDMPSNFLVNNFDIVTPLRLILGLQNIVNADIETTSLTIDDLLCMESHCAERNNSPIWHHHQTTVIKPMQQIKLYDKLEFKQKNIAVNDDFIHRLIGILDVNSFDVRTPNSVVCN